jgi:uncharacterized protein
MLKQIHRPWIMHQSWGKALFAHWPVSVQSMRDLVPSLLQIDTFDKQAWISLVSFEMSHVRLRGLPALPFANRFPELNVRTYVIHQNKPGIFFFSCDASNRLAVIFGRATYHLPYFYAQMSLTPQAQQIQFTSQRIHRHTLAAAFHCQYRPTSDVFQAVKDSLDDWLMERYHLYATHRNKLYRTDVHHLPWPLQHAEAEFAQNTVAKASLISLPADQQPILRYAEKVKVQVWPYVRQG